MNTDNRIGRTKDGTKLVINEFLANQDLVTLIKFHNSFDVVFEDCTKQKDLQRMMNAISTMRTQGATRFFDAVGYAVEKIQKNF